MPKKEKEIKEEIKKVKQRMDDVGKNKGLKGKKKKRYKELAGKLQVLKKHLKEVQE